jgi:hypothetical protein
MRTSSTPEDTTAECKRRIDECYALLESTIVPEYRQALLAMAKAWMKIAQSEGKILANPRAVSEPRLRVSSKSVRDESRALASGIAQDGKRSL